jgi:hypothetical protein
MRKPGARIQNPGDRNRDTGNRNKESGHRKKAEVKRQGTGGKYFIVNSVNYDLFRV